MATLGEGFDNSKEDSVDHRQAVPAFVYGLSFLISTILSSGVAAYLAVQSSVDKYIDSNKQVRILEIQSADKRSDQNSESLRSFDSQLSDLRTKLAEKVDTAEAIAKTERDKASALEKQIADLREELVRARSTKGANVR